MEVCIKGAGWVTPVGMGLKEVWSKIMAGGPAPVSTLSGGPGRLIAATVPAKWMDGIGRNPRLRRSSNISLYAVAAALDALKDAGLEPAAVKCAVVFAVCDGGVIYTRKFYDQVVKDGAGSPLLFPETVYNAPGSHIAALLGLDGMSYTVVGDGSAGIAALELGAQLVSAGQVEHCIVAGAEEADWVLAEAYRKWRLARREGETRGALIADGAAAVVLGREGGCRMEGVRVGAPFFRRSEARASLEGVLKGLPDGEAPALVVSGANGTFADEAEREAVEAVYGVRAVIRPKETVGEAFGAGALMQVVCAVQRLREAPSGRVLAPVVGLNEQAGAAIFSARG